MTPSHPVITPGRHNLSVFYSLMCVLKGSTLGSHRRPAEPNIIIIVTQILQQAGTPEFHVFFTYTQRWRMGIINTST